MKKILITGANGQLGRCLQDHCLQNKVSFIALDRSQCNLSKPVELADILETYDFEVLVNCAAYTNVDKAEEEPELAHLINTEAPQAMAQYCKDHKKKLIHISTDYVFDGTSSQAYHADNPTGPQCIYGQTKLDGEGAIQSIDPDYVIIRTAWVFSEYGNNFVKTMLRLAETRSELKVVNDQFGSPTYAGDLAEAIIYAINQNFTKGIYHFSGSGKTHWAGFSEEIFAQAYQLKLIPQQIKVHGIPTSDYPTPAQRPQYSLLESSAFTSKDWKPSLKKVLLKLKMTVDA